MHGIKFGLKYLFQFSIFNIWVTTLILLTSLQWINGALQENIAFYSDNNIIDPEIAILMDMSDGAKINGMDQHMARTVKRWIKYNILEGDAVGVAQTGASNFIHLPMTVVGDMSQRITLASKIKPTIHGESNPMKGINLAEQLFLKEGGLIVSLSYKKWEEVYIGANEKKTLLNVLQKKLKVVHIVLQKNTSPHGYRDLNSHAQFIHVSVNSLHVQHEIRIVGIDTALEEVITAFFSTWGQSNMSTTTILQKEILIDHKADERNIIPITVFSSNQFRRVDISVHFLFEWYACQLSHDFPECDKELNGRDEELSTLWISYPCNMTGTQNLYLTCPTNYEEPSPNYVFLRVTEVCTFAKNGNKKPLKFNCIACKDRKTQGQGGDTLEHENSLCKQGGSHISWNSNGPHPVIIMSQIEENNQSLGNVTIMITAEDISYPTSTFKNQTEVLKLHDGGWGADGINKDKIYSGYFPPSGDFGYHCWNNSLPCNISLTCSAIGYGLHHGKFQLQIRGPPFQFQRADEPYPPDKIRDLKGEQTGSSSNLHITWTAAGRFLGNGKVSAYAFQLKNDCNDNSSITNGHLEDEILVNRENKRIYFKLPSSPGYLSNYTLNLKDLQDKVRGSSQTEVCFVIEAIGESQKRTQSNCACTTLTYDSNTSNVTLIIVISLAALIALMLAIFVWQRKKILRRYHSYTRHRNKARKSSDRPTYFDGQVVTLSSTEVQSLRSDE